MNIICLGDSFTFGPMVDPSERWTDQLSRKTGHTFVNRGVSGDTTSGMLARLRSDVISDSPRLALLTGGANDLIVCGNADIIKNNLMAMVHQLFAAGVRPVIAAPIPCIPEMVPALWRDFADFTSLNEQLAELNDWEKRFSKAFLCGSMDLFSPMLQALGDPSAAERYYLDGLHLSAEGHRFIADTIAQQLERYLK